MVGKHFNSRIYVIHWFFLSCILLISFDSVAGMSSSMKQAIELAKQVVSQQSQVPTGQIKVQGAEAVEWPDGSLGCPEKGKVYTQAILPGYRIKLRISDQVYDVHTAGKQAKICTANRDEAHTGHQIKKSETIDLLSRARRDLSQRLDVPEARVRVKSIVRVEWQEMKNSCSATDLEDGVQGYRLDLLIEDRQHRYFGVAGGRLIYCQSAAE